MRGLCFPKLIKTQPLRAHLPFFEESLRVGKRIVAPLALFVATRKVPEKGVLVEPFDRRVYPAKANRFFDKLTMCGKRLPRISTP